MIVCISEDRPNFEPGVRLLLMSLTKHCPNLPVYLIFRQRITNLPHGWRDTNR